MSADKTTSVVSEQHLYSPHTYVLFHFFVLTLSLVNLLERNNITFSNLVLPAHFQPLHVRVYELVNILLLIARHWCPCIHVYA